MIDGKADTASNSLSHVKYRIEMRRALLIYKRAIFLLQKRISCARVLLQFSRDISLFTDNNYYLS